MTGLESQQPHMDKRQHLAPSQFTNWKLILKLELFTLTYGFSYDFVFNGVAYFSILYANTSLIRLTIRRFKLNAQNVRIWQCSIMINVIETIDNAAIRRKGNDFK